MGPTSIVLAVVGAFAATAVTAAALSSPDRPSTQPFAPVDRDDWLTTIPDDVSATPGLPEAGGDVGRVTEAVRWPFCGTEAFPVGEALDAERQGATGPEYADRRDLRLFADDREAHAFITRAARVARGCPSERHGATRWLHTVAPADLGEEAVRVVQTYETDGMTNAGATWWTLVRVGNAVLLTATGGEYLPGETLGQGIREHDQLLGGIVESMCVFSVEGCRDADR